MSRTSRAQRARWIVALLGAALFATAAGACLGTAGGQVFAFDAYAAGPADATAGAPYTFTSGRGYEVTLTRAELWIGAVYLNRSVSASGITDTTCTLAGIYVAEVTSGAFIDVLSPALQPFPAAGRATDEHASTAEVWLSGADVNAAADPTVILDVAGEATRGGVRYPFEGTVTIGQNRKQEPSDPALPGAKPICKERVVSPIAVDLAAEPGDALVVRVDPRGWFQNVDFALLEGADEATEGNGPLVFRDDDGDQPSRNLYGGLRAGATYSMEWVPSAEDGTP